MGDSDIVILTEREVRSLLAGRELDVVATVSSAYKIHSSGGSSLPQSSFLRFPEDPTNRIIALPGYLGGDFKVAGIKWISSFPGNLSLGLERASAAVMLNSTETGRLTAILEGSVISARRTAASAALAADCLRGDSSNTSIGIVGCGVISFEIIRFLRALWSEARSFAVYDVDAERSRQFTEKCRKVFGDIEVEVAPGINSIFDSCSLTSFATTALQPHVDDLSHCRPGSTILHISLRDLSVQSMLSCENIVDDVDHVCRAQTSIHLAEQATGHRDFIRCTLGDILNGVATPREDKSKIAVFSPFGLGVLDLAVSKLVLDLAREENVGMIVESFASPENLPSR